ncbi:MAG: hypothetical protein M3Q45_08530, partial [Chloroflexota bacterium]|nr:hypothetical protein [Chloroflexota bacterium]
PLRLTSWERGEAVPGATLPVTLFWQSSEPITQQINTSLRVVGADGTIYVREDGPPARGIIPTTLFFDQPTPDIKTLSLPTTLPSGRYRLEISAYDVATVQPLAKAQAIDWFTVGPPPVAPSQPIDAQWTNGLQLIGADAISHTVPAGETVGLRLVWSTLKPLAQDYTVFVHLVGTEDKLIAQQDQAPEDGFYPTSGWDTGEWVADTYALIVPADTASGEYQLLVGFYDPQTGERLLLNNGENGFAFSTLSVVAK